MEAGAQTIGGCPVFPANNIWNARVDTLPVHGRSAAWVNSIGPSSTLHQDFGGELYNGIAPGIPINLVPGTQPKVAIIANEGKDETDPGPYPIPPDAKVEGGSDRHLLVVDTTNCVLYETLAAYKNADNSWNIYSGAIFDLRKNLLRPQFWTSADAAGLPIMPGLARYEEILEGEIRHALRFTAPRTTREFLWPARHYASYVNDANLPSMGARFRLKQGFDISSFSPTTKIILTALKNYGMMVADNGSSWYIQGTFDTRWPNLADEWRRIPGSAFEAVDTSSLMESIDSAAVKGSTATTPTLQSATVTPASVTGGQGSTLRVSLSGPAGAGGLQVTLASSNGAVSGVPASTLIPEGSASVDIPLATTAVASLTTVTFTATLAGINKQAALTVNPPAATLQSAAFLSSTVIGGQAATLRISLSAAAGSGGVTVTLASGNTNAATIAGSVQIPSGSASADVPVTTKTVGSATQVIFTAGLGSTTRQATLTVNPPISVTLGSTALALSSVTGGTNTTLQISLSQAATSNTTVSLSSSNPGAASVPGSVSVPAGSSSVQAAVTTSPVGSVTQVVITATLGSVSRQSTLTVNPPALSAVTVSPGAVQGGAPATGTVTLSARAPSAGVMVTLASGNTAAATVPGSVQIPGGQTSATFAVTTKTVSAATTVNIAATALGRTVIGSVGVNPAPAPQVTVTSVSASTISANGWALGWVYLSGPAVAGATAPVLTSGGVVDQVSWLSPISPGSTSGMLIFHASARGAGTISVSYGGVTKTATVTAR
jgi:hypothetical protein